jgi:carbon storage regulator CsrA
MLVLARKSGEALVIADRDTVITILEVRGGRDRIIIESSPEMRNSCREVWERIQSQGKDAPVEHATPPAVAEAASALL